jgi:hypothetical protein
MNKLMLLMFAPFLTACNTQKMEESSTQKVIFSETIAPANNPASKDADETDTTDYDYATYYIVIADTNLAYLPLQQKMHALNKRLNIPIDTMGRYYNKEKNLICLRDDDEDEMYAGSYTPRRFPSEVLSLEYLDLYMPKGAGEKTIALVVGIYEAEKSADSALAIIQPQAPNTFKVKADMFIGCMH